MFFLPRPRVILIQPQLPVAVFILASFLLNAPDMVLSQTQNVPKQSSAGARSAAPASAIKPSLDLLKARVNEFWSLLARERKSEALQYVEPSRRADFKAWAMPAFSEPRLTTLALSPKAEEVSVTVEVKRVLILPPMPATPISWPLTESWVFRNGNWFVLVESPPTQAALFSGTPGRPNVPPVSNEETAKRQKAIRDALHFETTEFTFGTVRRGDSVALSLGYELTGNEAFGIRFKDWPDDFYLPDGTLPAGKAQIKAEFLTKAYAGEVNEKLTAIISSHGTETPYEFTLHGFVYTPVYTTPMALRFLSGEREKEILVKNISKSEVVINNHLSTKEFDVTPLPQTIPPGGTCTLKVTIVKDRPEKNLIDTLSLSFDKSVEDLGGLDVGIIRNYQEVHQKSQAEELQELLKKSGLPIKK